MTDDVGEIAPIYVDVTRAKRGWHAVVSLHAYGQSRIMNTWVDGANPEVAFLVARAYVDLRFDADARVHKRINDGQETTETIA